MSTHRVNIDQVKDRLSDLISVASEGGEVIIEQNGKAVARLISATDVACYKAYPPTAFEFFSDKESLGWEAEGWENVA